MSHKVFQIPNYEPKDEEEVTLLEEMLSMPPGEKRNGRALIGIYIELKKIRELMEEKRIPY